jgi:hypothetical protein
MCQRDGFNDVAPHLAHGMAGEIAARGVPAPIQVGRRWVIERTHA